MARKGAENQLISGTRPACKWCGKPGDLECVDCVRTQHNQENDGSHGGLAAGERAQEFRRILGYSTAETGADELDAGDDDGGRPEPATFRAWWRWNNKRDDGQ